MSGSGIPLLETVATALIARHPLRSEQDSPRRDVADQPERSPTARAFASLFVRPCFLDLLALGLNLFGRRNEGLPRPTVSPTSSRRDGGGRRHRVIVLRLGDGLDRIASENGGIVRREHEESSSPCGWLRHADSMPDAAGEIPRQSRGDSARAIAAPNTESPRTLIPQQPISRSATTRTMDRRTSWPAAAHEFPAAPGRSLVGAVRRCGFRFRGLFGRARHVPFRVTCAVNGLAGGDSLSALFRGSCLFRSALGRSGAGFVCSGTRGRLDGTLRRGALPAPIRGSHGFVSEGNASPGHRRRARKRGEKRMPTAQLRAFEDSEGSSPSRHITAPCPAD